ncbi:MAG TPA: DUF6186 family protein [Acidimicrobiia bacterium]|nr:DUF6186 family protein [Acidimicrobiia bacterium]
MSRTVTLAGFAALAVAAVTYQALGVTRRQSPTLGQAVLAVLHTRFGRPALLTAWLWLGWHLFVRGAYL